MSRNALGILVLLAAGGALGTVAVLARERSYVVPEHERPLSIPLVLSGAVPSGYAVRTFDVEGICCQGCSSKLHGALLAVEGVREAAVDPLTAVVMALAPLDMPDARLEAALTFDKYSAKAR
ncbi:MAG: heavy-metal-associated domain-containing protein [Planctomycetes bacterium]|nr:heavy-metal-associated domain-containing protein [Planctomycetota bacterium]